MRSFYLSLAVLALAANPLEAVKTSGLLRQRKTQTIKDRHLQTTKGSKGSTGVDAAGDGSSKGKGKSSVGGTGVTVTGACDYVVPTCEDPTGASTSTTTTTTSSSKGKGGKGDSRRGRFLEEQEFAEELGRALRFKGKSDSGTADIAATSTGKSSKGKGSLGLSATSTGKSSKGKGSSGVATGEIGTNSADVDCCGEPTNMCAIGDPDQTVECFDVITTYKTLKTSLGCDSADNLEDPRPVLTVEGPDGVLDCSGHGNNQIYDPTPNMSSKSVGVRLLNGGKLINCHIAGFQVGVEMIGSGTNTITGSTIYNVQYGIETSPGHEFEATDNGCYSISCTNIVGATNIGINVRNGGTTIITNTDVLGSGSVGIHFSPRVNNGDLYAALSDVNVFATNRNGAHGILVGETMELTNAEIRQGSSNHAPVTVEIFELTKIIGAGRSGYVQKPAYPEDTEFYNPAATIVTGALDVQGSTDNGIWIQGGTWTVGECGAVEACTSQTLTDEANTTAAFSPSDTSRTSFDMVFALDVSDEDYENLGAQYCESANPKRPEMDGEPICSANMCSTDISIAIACGPPPETLAPEEEPGADVCDTCGKPTSFIGTFTGIDAPVADSPQSNKAYVENSGVAVSDVVLGADETLCATVTLMDKAEDLILKLPSEAGTKVCVGQQFVVSSPKAGEKLPAETNMLFDWGSGSQMVSYHTSCSAPFVQNDQVGVFQLTGYTGVEGCGFGPNYES
eukprot:scaffold6550_cov167-Amphora_coffeaeformis.AAC.6